jgi:hypothetical protein
MIPCLSKTLWVECLGCGFQGHCYYFCKGFFRLHMYPALFTSLLFFRFSRRSFYLQRHYFSKLILIVAFINVLLWLPAISTNTFKWLLLKNKLTYLLILLRITLIISTCIFWFSTNTSYWCLIKESNFHEAL